MRLFCASRRNKMSYANCITSVTCFCMGMFLIADCLTKEIERTNTMDNLYPYHEEEVSYKNKAADVTLAGTLTLPENKHPVAAVLLIAGHGPNDRDYTLMGHKRFRVLAEHLTQCGVAVLRFDKRGVGKSTGKYKTATSRDFADDVAAGLAYLKTRKEIDSSKIGLIGHSEGGMISCMIASKSTEIAFVILLAGVVQTAIDDLVTQTAQQLRADGARSELLALDRTMRTEMFTIIQQESNAEIAKEKLQKLFHDYCDHLPESIRLESASIPFAITKEKIDGMISVFNSPWYRYFLTCKPEDMLNNIKVSMLALYGDKDWITSSQQSIAVITKECKESGNQDCTVLEIPNINHTFQTCATGAMAEYATIQETLSPVVLTKVSDWILARI